MTVANRSMGNAQVRINTQSQRGVLWACVLVLAVFGGACALSPCAMAQVSAAEQAKIDKFCAEHGTDVTKTGQYAKTLLHIAAEKEGVAVVRFLIEKGDDISAKNEFGETPLHCAAQKNTNPEVLKLLIDKGADVNNAKSKDGETPLYYAVTWNDNSEVVKLLIEKGADVNAKNNRGTTPLHSVAMRNNVYVTVDEKPEVIKFSIEVIKMLIEKGADVNAQNKDGSTPLDIARENENAAVVEYLSGPNVPKTTASRASTEIDKFCAEYGTDVKKTDNDGKTLLHIAAEKKEGVDVVRFLIDKGADINARDKDGRTPLQRVISYRFMDRWELTEDNVEIRALLTGAIYLNAEVNKSGFEYVDGYASYGSFDLYEKLRNAADEFDRPGIKAQIEAKQREIAHTEFFGEYPYSTANVKVEGDVSSVTLVLDTGFSATQISGNFTSPFPDVKCSDRDDTTPDQIVGYAFLTKDDKLRLIQPSERQAIADDGGFVYARFRNSGKLVFTISGTTDSIKNLVRGKDSYRVIVVFSGLSYSSKSLPIAYCLINNDGTLRAGKFTGTSGDPISNPFITDKSEEVEKVSAEVIKIAIIKGKGLFGN